MKIAVVGSGISGLSAAYYLSKKHHVDLFEKDDHFGGHAHTLKISYEDKKEVVAKKEIKHKKMQKFMESSAKYYTLNITTEIGLQEAKYVLKKYSLLDSGITYEYGKNLSKAKVLYGIYPTYKDAQSALTNLNPAIVDKHAPYIDSVNKHQKLYNKYN